MTDNHTGIVNSAEAPERIWAASEIAAEVDREALVKVILDAMLGRYPGRDMARAVADALIAAGWHNRPVTPSETAGDADHPHGDELVAAYLAGQSRAETAGDNVEALASFSAWFRKNYPGPDTIIHNPDSHARSIFRAAIASIGGQRK